VRAGYSGTVAPLGTALTEDQLGLLWKMANEPILCFDGDGAGRRAAYRAVDLALPRLQPGKSVRFALLPEGQDPDDLVRSGGREAIAEVLASARSLADMLWARETEAAAYDTPERRAALEARIHGVVRGIGDDSVRKYYAQDFSERLRQLLMPKLNQTLDERVRGRFGEVRGGGWRDAKRGLGAAWADRWTRSRLGPRESLGPPSPRLSASPIVRGFRSSLPPREALILLTVINHPWLLEHHAEEFAELEFLNPDANALRRTVLETGIEAAVTDNQALRAAIERRGLAPMLARVEAAITHGSDWPARADAAAADVAQWWAHVVTLHRKQRTLNRELKEAERALGEEPSDANLAWLRDVQGRLSALDGSEAQIEGFGSPSGRPARSL
jgi:DNA primase